MIIGSKNIGFWKEDLYFTWPNCRGVAFKSRLVNGTVKSLNFMGIKFRGLTMMDMFVDIWIAGFQFMRNIIKVNKNSGRELKFVDFTIHQKHKIKCTTNKNNITVNEDCLHSSTWTWTYQDVKLVQILVHGQLFAHSQLQLLQCHILFLRRYGSQQPRNRRHRKWAQECSGSRGNAHQHPLTHHELHPQPKKAVHAADLQGNVLLDY